jgi:hypothetical protein
LRKTAANRVLFSPYNPLSVDVQAPKTIDLLLNAFRPATEMDDPTLFAGRREELRALAETLHVRGSAPVIFGDRGLGKSSLALQLQRVAMGDLELLSEYGFESYGFDMDTSWLVFYVPCTDETRTVPDIIQRLINSVSSVSLSAEAGGVDHLVDRTTTFQVSLKLFKAETSRRYQARVEARLHEDLSLEERLLDCCRTLTDVTGHGVLLIIDELDRLRDASGLAALTKTASSKDLKFMFVGIAQNLADLIDDHQSIERMLTPVPVSLMSPPELATIIDRALVSLEEYQLGFEFAPDVRSSIADIACGFPWFVHVLGQASLREAYDLGNRVVTQEHLASAIHDLTNNRFAQQFSDRYQTAVRDSPRRELVLKMFAQWRRREIPTGAIYPVLKQMGVVAPSVYKGHLTSDSYGRVLLTPPFQPRGVVRFANEMFKVYVRLRSPIFEVSHQVEEAYRQMYPSAREGSDRSPSE